MKKFIAFAFVAFSVFCANALTATVVSVKGKVEIQEAGMWVKLQEGDVLEKGTVISTGFNSEAVLKVSNSSFTLGPLTRVTIESLVSTKEKDSTQIYIDSGSIAANVSGKDGKRAGFKVRSPVATASVRGTAFIVSSSGKLTVTEGLVAFGAAESADSFEDESSEDAVSEKPADGAGTDQGHANAFASTSDVGGEGVPVAAGQSSKASVSGRAPSNPRAEMAKGSVGGTDNTVTLSSRNSVASGSSAATSVSAPVSASAAAAGSISASVKVVGSLAVTTTFAPGQ
ncbi:FecR domain-containing protein [Treponema sp.]|uniref:FecR family protein n=1 Tax=Treponema sp. TaxID=166 RepID=UPI00388E9031